jgi:hypothetical protein
LEESAVTAGAKVTAANQEVANAKRIISNKQENLFCQLCTTELE